MKRKKFYNYTYFELYNCVKENYDLITRLNTLKQDERNMDNLVFRFLVFSLRDTYGQLETLHGIPVFKEDIPEYEFFNKMVNESKHISNIADNVATGILRPKMLYSEMYKYCEYMQDFYLKYSLYIR